MKHIAQSLTLGLAVLAASSVAPKAADWTVGSGGARPFGSVKDYASAGVPVPAPRPAPDEGAAEWYLRGDIGWNLASSVDVTATGGITARDDLNSFTFGSIGGGRYITPSLRAELMFDFRPKKQVTSGSQTFNHTFSQKGPDGACPLPCGGVATTTDVSTYTVTHSDNSSTRDHTAFFNLYYDFNNHGRFTPYVGAGLGLDFKSYKRSYTQTAVCTSAYNVDDTTGIQTAYAADACPVPTKTVTGFGADKYVTDIGLAAAFMVGASYKISHNVAIDTGYRLIWEGAQVSATGTGINGDTSIKISDKLDHEIHTGIRVDLN